MEDRLESEDKVWAAIEELRRGQAVRAQKLDAFELYQRERNSEIINEVSKVDSKVDLLRIDVQKYVMKEERLNKSFLTKGLWVLGAIVTSLIAYIWNTTVGHR
jgi:hypothetical protein